MPKVDTGVRHAHDIHGRLKSLPYVVQDLTDVTLASTPAGQSPICDKIAAATVVENYGTCGGAGLIVQNHTGAPRLVLSVTLEPLYASDPAAFLRLRVKVILPGYLPDLPAGATWSGSVGGEFYLDTTGDDYDVSWQFTTYLYYVSSGIYYFEVEDDPPPQLLVGPLVVTFTRQPDPVAPNGRDIGGDYDAYRRIWCGYDINHILKYALDTAILTPPLTAQPQIADPFHLDYEITALDAELVRQEGPTWDIGESGPLIAGSIAASHDYNFPVWADPVYDAPTTEDVSTVCHAVFDSTFSRWNQSCTNTTLSHSQTLGVKFAHYAAIEKYGEPTNKKNVAPAEALALPAISCLTLCDPGPAPGGGIATKSPAQLACLTLENVPNGRYAFDLAFTPELALDRQIIAGPAYDWIVADGVDLLATANGWLFATWRVDAAIKVARSLDQGATWPLTVTVASDAASDAAPALVVTPKDELFLWYHAASLAGKCWLLPDYLEAAPVLVASHPAYVFPRPCWWQDRILLAYMNGDTLLIDESFDFGVTLGGATSLGTQPRQRASLITDRFGLAHVLYVDGSGQLTHRWSDAPDVLGTWAGVAVFTSPADHPGLAGGARSGFATWSDAGTWELNVLRSDLGALETAATFPPVTPARLWPGAWIDRHEEYWLLLRAAGGSGDGGPLLPYVSPDEGLNWLLTIAGGFGP